MQGCRFARWRRSSLVSGAVLAAVVLLVACSGSNSSGGTGTTVTMQGLAFHPTTLTLPAGSTTLTVTNQDSTLHSFTLDDGSVSKDVPPGTTVQVPITLPASGSFGWHCRIHAPMTGAITVG